MKRSEDDEMNFKCFGLLLAIVSTFGAFQRTASADLLFIENPSFEANILPDGGFASVAVGWLTPGDSGTFNPTAANYTNEAPDGQNIAYSAVGGPTISQVLGDTLQADMVYTLTMEVGHRIGFGFPGYQIDFMAGNTVLASDVNTLSPASGEFELATVTYTSSAADAELGEALQIRFRAFNAQAGFDDVRLDASAAIPEPTTASLAILLVVGVCSRRRRHAN